MSATFQAPFSSTSVHSISRFAEIREACDHDCRAAVGGFFELQRLCNLRRVEILPVDGETEIEADLLPLVKGAIACVEIGPGWPRETVPARLIRLHADPFRIKIADGVGCGSGPCRLRQEGRECQERA